MVASLERHSEMKAIVTKPAVKSARNSLLSARVQACHNLSGTPRANASVRGTAKRKARIARLSAILALSAIFTLKVLFVLFDTVDGRVANSYALY
jgi:hypothetical protein